MTLRKKTITGIIWNFAEQIALKGIGTVITLLLARFLTPGDYGLVAMMAVFLAIANSLMDSGFKQALIRLEGVGQSDFNTAFYTNLGLGIISYILLFLAAPLIASFYNEPVLIILIRIAGFNIIIQSFQVVQSAALSRALNFKAQLQATVPAGIVSGPIAIALAYMGFGIWALIVQMLLASLITTAMLWFLQGWRPSLDFSRHSMASMYNFGYKLFLSGFLDTVFQNLYVIVIAKLFSASVAGCYFFASKLRDLLISQLVGSIQNVTYPALATMQSDNKRLKEGYRKVIQVTTFLLFPSMLLLAALADPIFKALLPAKWLPASLYLQLMCIAAVMYPLSSINLDVLKVKGRSDLFLYLEIFKKIMVVLILAITYRYGVTAILIGQILGSVLAYIPNSFFSKKLISYTLREQVADFLPGLTLSGIVALIVYVTGLLLTWPALAKLGILALTSCVLYIVGSHIFKLQAYMFTRQMLASKMSSS